MNLNALQWYKTNFEMTELKLPVSKVQALNYYILEAGQILILLLNVCYYLIMSKYAENIF